MPSALKLAGVTFAAPLIPAPPVIASELMWTFFGRSSGASGNRTVGGGALTNIGTGPVIQPTYGQFTPADAAIRTPVAGIYAGVTMMMAVRFRAGGTTGAATRLMTPSVGGNPTWMITTSTNTVTLVGTTTNNTQANLVINKTNWNFLVARIGGGGTIKINNLTAGTSSSDGGTGGSLNTGVPASFIDINSGSSAVNTFDRIDAAFAGIWGAYLNDTDMGNVYASVKASLALRGITV